MVTAMASVPTITLADVSCGLEGEEGDEEEDVVEGDVVTCSAHVTLTRPSHAQQGAQMLKCCSFVWCWSTGLPQGAVLKPPVEDLQSLQQEACVALPGANWPRLL